MIESPSLQECYIDENSFKQQGDLFSCFSTQEGSFSYTVNPDVFSSSEGLKKQFFYKNPLSVEEKEQLQNLSCEVCQEYPLEISTGGIPFYQNPVCFFPTCNEDILEIIALARKYERKIKVLGSMHSLSPVYHTNDYLISLGKMNRILAMGESECEVEAGVVLRDLCYALEKKGLALPVLGSICEQTISGAIITGTRGQVPHEGSLASIVTALEYIDGMGVVHKVSLKDDPEQLHAAAISLGLLGVVTKVTVRCVPLFLMAEVIQLMSFEEFFSRVEELKKCEKLHLYWNVAKDTLKVITGHRVNVPFSSTEIQSFSTLGEYPHMHSMEDFPDHIHRIGKSWDVLTLLHWSEKKIEKKFHQMKVEKKGILQGDYSIAQERLQEVLEAIKDYFQDPEHCKHLAKNKMVLEIRPVKSDEVWLSPSYHRDSWSICLHDFERDLDWTAMDSSHFKAFESFLKKFFVRPHFGKAHLFNNLDLERVFPRWNDFKRLRQQRDPEDVFLTPYLQQMFLNQERLY